MNIWEQVSNIGIAPSSSDSTRQEIRLSNQIAIFALPLVLFFFGWKFSDQNLTFSIGFMGIAVSLLAIPLFNSLSRTILSRLILGCIPVLCLTLPGIWFKSIELNDFQLVSYAILPLSILPAFLLNIQKEQLWLFGSLIFNFFAIHFLEHSLMNFVVLDDDSSVQLALIQTQIPSAFVYLLLSGSILLYKALSAKLRQELTDRNKSLELTINDLHSKLNEAEVQVEQAKADQNKVLKRNKSLTENGFVMLQMAKSDFVQHGILSGALEEVARTVSLSLSLSRTSIWLFEKENMTCVKLYSKINSSFYEGFSIKVEHVKAFKRLLESVDLVAVDDTTRDQRVDVLFKHGVLQTNIKSMIISPFEINGEMRGLVMGEQAEIEENWGQEEINLLHQAADVLNMAYSSNQVIKEVDQIKQQNEQILEHNEFLESQKALILDEKKKLEEEGNKLKSSLESLQEVEASLRLKESEARGILDAINDHNLVVEYNLKGDITWMNESTRELMHIPNQELKGVYKYSIKSLLLRSNHFSHIEYDSFWSSMMRGVSRKYQLQISLPGTELWVAATFLPIGGEKDKIERILVVAHDISTVKNQQKFIENQNQKLKEQRKEIAQINNSLENRVNDRTKQLEQQNQQLTEYAFINAHLLRAPVCNILGLIDLLKNGALREDQTEIVKFLDESTKELDEMVMKINRAIKKGYYDDPVLTEQVKSWKRKRELRDRARAN